MTLVNIFVLVILKNFIVYLISGIILSLICNYIKGREVSKRYQYLSNKIKIKSEYKKKYYLM